MDDAENDDDVKLLFAIDEAANLLQETGYRKSICQLQDVRQGWLEVNTGGLSVYHCMLKVKAAMDQFAEGLEELHVLEVMRKHSILMKPLFVNNTKPLTAGDH